MLDLLNSLHIAKDDEHESLTIPEIAQAFGRYLRS